MSEDPTRAMPLDPDRPAYGRVGPADPRADPATSPGLPVVGHEDPATDPGLHPVRIGGLGASPEAPTVPVPGAPHRVGQTRTGIVYVGLILSAIVLLVLLIFILQNLDPVQIFFLGFSGSLPVGVAMLLSAIAGVLLVALPGGLRIMQLRRAARRAGR